MREEKGLAGKLGKERRKEREFKIYLIADEMEYNLKKENLVFFFFFFFLTQAKYISNLHSQANLTDCKLVDTPTELNARLNL